VKGRIPVERLATLVLARLVSRMEVEVEFRFSSTASSLQGDIPT
jgi:hypothetical protein